MKLSDNSTNITRGFTNLQKGGAGSRGGKVIGTTKSGKPIYDTHDHEGHKSFTRQDHQDAMRHHETKRDKVGFDKQKDGSYKENSKYKKHNDRYWAHEKEMMKVPKSKKQLRSDNRSGKESRGL